MDGKAGKTNTQRTEKKGAEKQELLHEITDYDNTLTNNSSISNNKHFNELLRS